MARKLRVTQVRSTISHIARNRATVRALGLKRIGDSVEVPDNDATRGMVRQVRFLVSVEEVGGDEPATKAPAAKAASAAKEETTE
jgi:large subunit ribosomal protein L30